MTLHNNKLPFSFHQVTGTENTLKNKSRTGSGKRLEFGLCERDDYKGAGGRLIMTVGRQKGPGRNFLLDVSLN